jgi:zinc transport system substrate-binding protein
MNKKLFVLPFVTLLIGTIFVFSGCTNETTTSDAEMKAKNEKINILVSILPQVEFVEKIGGEKVDVHEMIPPGFSPATYDPSPEELKKLQGAEIYFRIGHIPFEKAQMDKLADLNSEMIVVDTSKNIPLLEMVAHSHGDEVHEDEHTDEDEHEHEGGSDPHIWLSPKLVKIQAKHITDTLISYSPENEEYFTANYNAFIDELKELDSALETTFEPINGETILVFHPAFGYLADAYDFEQEAIEIEGKDPSPEHLKNIIDEAKEDNIEVIFVQKQFSTKSAQAIADEIDGAVVQIDPLAKDYIENMRDLANVIVNELNK